MSVGGIRKKKKKKRVTPSFSKEREMKSVFLNPHLLYATR